MYIRLHGTGSLNWFPFPAAVTNADGCKIVLTIKEASWVFAGAASPSVGL